MKVENLNLVNLEGNLVTSVELSDKKAMSPVFGTWFRKKCTYADVVSWCDERVKEYQLYLRNLEDLQKLARKEMVQGMDVKALEAILAQMKGN